MSTIKTRTTAIIASTMLATTLGLAACGGAQSDAGANSSDATASSSQTNSNGSTVSRYNLEKVWVGMGEDTMTYYFQGAKMQNGAILVYHTNDETYECWIGKIDSTNGSQIKIVDEESGKTFGFTIVSTDDDGNITIKTDNGTELSLSPSPIDEVGSMLDDVSTYAKKIG